jgi:hypothetical protein
MKVKGLEIPCWDAGLDRPHARHRPRFGAPTRSAPGPFDVGRRFSCTMRVECGQLDPGAVIRPEPGEWHPRIPERLGEEELADWRAGRNAVYQLAALTVGARASSTHSARPGSHGIVGPAINRRHV